MIGKLEVTKETGSESINAPTLLNAAKMIAQLPWAPENKEIFAEQIRIFFDAAKAKQGTGTIYGPGVQYFEVLLDIPEYCVSASFCFIKPAGKPIKLMLVVHADDQVYCYEPAVSLIMSWQKDDLLIDPYVEMQLHHMLLATKWFFRNWHSMGHAEKFTKMDTPTQARQFLTKN